MGKTDIRETSRRMEDLFFRKENKELLEKHRILRAMQESREALASVSGIRNGAVLQKLVELNVRPETLVSLSLVPLVEIAWADGRVDDREKKAILAAVDQMKQALGSMDHALLKQWLEQRPPPQLLEAWIHYTQGLCEQLGPAEAAAMKEALLNEGRAIAKASGGFLHLGAKTSKAEAEVLKKLASAFPASG